jgi:hypothetical protein
MRWRRRWSRRRLCTGAYRRILSNLVSVVLKEPANSTLMVLGQHLHSTPIGMIQHAVAPPTTLTAAAPTAAPSLRTKPNVMILKLGVLVPNLYIRGINILKILGFENNFDVQQLWSINRIDSYYPIIKSISNIFLLKLGSYGCCG